MSNFKWIVCLLIGVYGSFSIGLSHSSSLDEVINVYESGQFEKSFEMFLELTGGNDGVAEYYIGNSYLAGLGIVKNQQLGIEWYFKSAATGNFLSQYNLGVI